MKKVVLPTLLFIVGVFVGAYVTNYRWQTKFLPLFELVWWQSHVDHSLRYAEIWADDREKAHRFATDAAMHDPRDYVRSRSGSNSFREALWMSVPYMPKDIVLTQYVQLTHYDKIRQRQEKLASLDELKLENE